MNVRERGEREGKQREWVRERERKKRRKSE